VPLASLALLVALRAADPAVAAAAPSPLRALAFLEGAWTAEPDARGATGQFTLAPELSGAVLVRRNRLAVPAGEGRPASVHEDLMVIWAEGAELRADYWDDEGHVIRYAVRTGTDRAEFLSGGPGPRFRLTYLLVAADLVEVKFEIAPPGKPEAFAPYLSGRARRTARRG
jgi:hypothetical protein